MDKLLKSYQIPSFVTYCGTYNKIFLSVRDDKTINRELIVKLLINYNGFELMFID